jgi:pantoate--beta-alanine ligase
VATVVAKLFNLVRPTKAFFGRKDYQQAVIIRRMVRDLAMSVDVRVLPTDREEDGLAMSSRNRYLSEEERSRTASLYRGLVAAREAFDGGERTSEVLISKVRDAIEAGEGLEPEYVAVVDPESLEPLHMVDDRAVILLAARVGAARLIDNVALGSAS